MKELHFPQGFLWGTATAAHQVEGNNFNNWTRHESLKRTFNGEASGIASDHYHRYEEDFAWIQKLNNNIYRFSIEWSRIEPFPGKFNQKEIAHYLKILKSLKQKGIKVMLTLWHFSNPIWFEDLGGFSKKENLHLIEPFVKKVVTEYKDFVDYWITINEPTTYIIETYIRGIFPPQKSSLIDSWKVYHNFIALHLSIYKIIHEFQPEAKVGIAFIISALLPFSPKSLLDRLCTRIIKYISYQRFLDKIYQQTDFIGLQYYHHSKIRFHLGGKFLFFDESGILSRSDLELDTNDLGWEIYPHGLKEVLLQISKYQKPIIITENGIADRYDKKRSKFIHDHLSVLWEAIQEGVDVQGYLHWSLMDNFEWNYGWDGRFGLLTIDRNSDLRRIPGDSFHYYAAICKRNALIPVPTKS
ncbi:MAG: glycoside hydrolase family 1 protein [bacterium]